MTERSEKLCTALNSRGAPCGAYRLHGRDVCAAHAGQLGGDTSQHRWPQVQTGEQTPEGLRRMLAGVGNGSNTVREPLGTDGQLAHSFLVRVVKRGKADATTVRAATEILAADASARTVTIPRSVAEIRELSTPDLERLVAALEHERAAGQPA